MRLRRELLGIEGRSVREVRRLFSGVRGSVNEAIRLARRSSELGDRIGSGEYAVLRRKIGSELERFRVSAVAYLEGRSLPEAALVGERLVVDGLDDMFHGAIGVLPDVTAELVLLSSQIGGELITGLTNEVRDRIFGILSRGVLGQKSAFELMREVESVLGRTMDVGAFGKAERIVRTEVGMTHNMAHLAKLEQVGNRFPGLRKVWHHQAGLLNPRPGHIEADGQSVEIGDMFVVRRDSKSPYERLRHPNDIANGSPANTVNCHCYMTVDEASIDTALSQAQERGLVPSGA